MAYDPTDSDASAQSAIGVGRIDPTSRALHETAPSWLQDGYGIRGPQQFRPLEPVAAREPMEFGSKTPVTGASAPSSEICIPGPSPNTSKIYVKATKYISGKWTCVWLEQCTGTCEA